MTESMVLRSPVDTAGRSVAPQGRQSSGALYGLYAVPALGLALVLANDAPGFRLLVGSASVVMLALIAGLHVRARALVAGSLRIGAAGPLTFVPPTSLRVIMVCVNIAFLLPGAAAAASALLGLPGAAGSSRLVSALPYVLAGYGLIALARQLWGARRPLGLRVDALGLLGVRGERAVEIAWEDLAHVSAPGPHGPKLALVTASGRTLVLDAHSLGSDPAAVAGVIEYFRARPERREVLENGRAAVEEVRAASR